MNTEEVEREIEKVNREVYGGKLPAHNKAVLRDMILKGSLAQKEDEFWARYCGKEELPNSNRTHDDY